MSLKVNGNQKHKLCTTWCLMVYQKMRMVMHRILWQLNQLLRSEKQPNQCLSKWIHSLNISSISVQPKLSILNLVSLALTTKDNWKSMFTKFLAKKMSKEKLWSSSMAVVLSCPALNRTISCQQLLQSMETWLFSVVSIDLGQKQKYLEEFLMHMLQSITSLKMLSSSISTQKESAFGETVVVVSLLQAAHTSLPKMINHIWSKSFTLMFPTFSATTGGMKISSSMISRETWDLNSSAASHCSLD